MPALEWQQANKLEIKVQGKKENLRRREDARKTHPRDGSLSVSNPTRALDTPSGYPWKRRKKKLRNDGRKCEGRIEHIN